VPPGVFERRPAFTVWEEITTSAPRIPAAAAGIVTKCQQAWRKGIVRRMFRRACASALVGAFLAGSAGATEVETLHYRWSLGGFFGTMARLFLPGQGDGTLTTSHMAGGPIEVELDITAPEAAGEFWRYGAEIDPAHGRTLRAWSSYRFRDRTDAKESVLDEEEMIDIASGIMLLRRDPPEAPRDLKIWNDGKVYPVVVVPYGTVRRKVRGEWMDVRHYSIRARQVPDERVWKGRFDLFLADDGESTPVEILVERRMARVRLLLEDSEDGDEEN
jgi:hypothetical protein